MSDFLSKFSSEVDINSKNIFDPSGMLSIWIFSWSQKLINLNILIIQSNSISSLAVFNVVSVSL